MQTFLPYADFHKSAACLDDKRLYKQIVECKQILNTLNGESSGWKNHPAVLMWRGYEQSLRNYQLFCLQEWLRRRWHVVSQLEGDFVVLADYPLWFGNDEFHKSHRLNLLYKDSEHYRKYFPEKTPKEKPVYYWPTKEGW